MIVQAAKLIGAGAATIAVGGAGSGIGTVFGASYRSFKKPFSRAKTFPSNHSWVRSNRSYGSICADDGFPNPIHFLMLNSDFMGVLIA